MGIEIQPYTPEREPAVRDFNARLKQGGVTFKFPEHSQSAWLPKGADESLFEEYFIACDGDSVRGGYILKHQLFWLNGKTTTVGSLYLPLSEGLINPAFSKVGVLLLMNALKRQPLLYALGMGSLENPLPKMLKAAGWQLWPLPFYFRVVNSREFLKNIQVLRRKPAMGAALDVLAATGIGNIGIRALNALQRPPKSFRDFSAEPVDSFGAWADDVWAAGREKCRLAAQRDSKSLNTLYPASKEKFLRLKISRGSEVVGWCVMLDTRMVDNKYFGNLRLGSIIDTFAVPGNEGPVVLGALEFLEKRGVDLIVSNQSHERWCEAFQLCGYRTARSNYIFAGSPKLSASAFPDEMHRWFVHFNRGDGEGPTHL